MERHEFTDKDPPSCNVLDDGDLSRVFVGISGRPSKSKILRGSPRWCGTIRSNSFLPFSEVDFFRTAHRPGVGHLREGFANGDTRGSVAEGRKIWSADPLSDPLARANFTQSVRSASIIEVSCSASMGEVRRIHEFL